MNMFSTAFAAALLSGAALAATPVTADPIGDKANAAENNATHVLNDAAPSGTAGAVNINGAVGQAGSPGGTTNGGNPGVARTQHAMGEGNSGTNHTGAAIAK